MVKVPIWEQNVSSLPGASNIPHATPEAFGSQVGKAQAFAGRAIGSGIAQMGEALPPSANEQGAIASKSALSDHETAVGQEEIRLDRELPADQASAKPKMLRDFAANDWNERRGSIYGRNLPQADATVHNFHNRKGLAVGRRSGQDNDIYVEKQIDGSAEKQSALCSRTRPACRRRSTPPRRWWRKPTRNDPGQARPAEQVRAAILRRHQQGLRGPRASEPAGREGHSGVGGLQEERQEHHRERLGIQELPETPLGGRANSKRVSDIDKTPIGKVVDKAAKAHGVDPGVLKTVAARREQAATRDAVTGNNKGVIQLSDDMFAKYGRPGGNIFDAKDNVFATARKMADENARFTTAMAREPTPTEQYMIHQQGDGGAATHTNPDRLAWQKCTPRAKAARRVRHGRRKRSGATSPTI